MKPQVGYAKVACPNVQWCMLGCIFKALIMNESALIFRYKQKLFMAGGHLYIMLAFFWAFYVKQKH